MITLYSYPELFGLADNNPYGLKIYAFLRLCDLPFAHQHVFDASKAPRGQLPYIEDDGEVVGDSDGIVRHLTRKYGLTIDADLTQAERDTDLLLRRTLDDLYWVMSYSRWADERYWRLFRDQLLATHAELTVEALDGAEAFNAKRYYYQGIGRYAPDDAYRRGLADLEVLAHLIQPGPFLFGDRAHGIDAAGYGFLANIHFYTIDTPLKQFVAGRPRLVDYCELLHWTVTR
jgi:glutathione S-transferase